VLPSTNYTVTETDPSVTPGGWTFGSLTCTTGGSVSVRTATINVPAGGTVTCTYTNDKIPTLTVVKNVRSNLSSATFFFGLDAPSGPANFPASGVVVPISGGLGQGSYSLTDVSLLGTHKLYELISSTLPQGSGFILTDISCSGGSNVSIDLPGGSGTFTIGYGDNVTCTFVNSNVGTTRTQGF